MKHSRPMPDALLLSWRPKADRFIFFGIVAIAVYAVLQTGLATMSIAQGQGERYSPTRIDSNAVNSRNDAPRKLRRRTSRESAKPAPLPWHKPRREVVRDIRSFCLAQRRTCRRICATYFRFRPSCRFECRSSQHNCLKSGCFQWRPTLWRLAARHGAQHCG